MAVTYFMKAVPHQFAGWAPDLLTLLDTDGYGLVATDETKHKKWNKPSRHTGSTPTSPRPGSRDLVRTQVDRSSSTSSPEKLSPYKHLHLTPSEMFGENVLAFTGRGLHVG